MIVASMAVMSSRVENLNMILSSLERQTRPPDKVLLYYSVESWHLDQGMPFLSIPKIKLNIEVIKVPNIGSCRKYLFSLERYRDTNNLILLLDDDLVWGSSVVENLFNNYKKFKCAVTTRGWSKFDILETERGKILSRNNKEDTIVGDKINKPIEVMVASSGWATMFSAEDVNKKIFNQDIQFHVSLGYSDEVFLSAMLLPKKMVIPMEEGFYKILPKLSALFNAPETSLARALQMELLLKMNNFNNET